MQERDHKQQFSTPSSSASKHIFALNNIGKCHLKKLCKKKITLNPHDSGNFQFLQVRGISNKLFWIKPEERINTDLYVYFFKNRF